MRQAASIRIDCFAYVWTEKKQCCHLLRIATEYKSFSPSVLVKLKSSLGSSFFKPSLGSLWLRASNTALLDEWRWGKEGGGGRVMLNPNRRTNTKYTASVADVSHQRYWRSFLFSNELFPRGWMDGIQSESTISIGSHCVYQRDRLHRRFVLRLRLLRGVNASHQQPLTPL